MAEQRYTDTTDGRDTPADSSITLRLHGITDAFLTRLEDDGDIPPADDTSGSIDDTSGNARTGDTGSWYLYGRIAVQETDDGKDAGHQSPRRQNAQGTRSAQNAQIAWNTQNTSTQNTPSARNAAGIFLWTSPDLRQWSAPRKVLDVHDIPWATAQPTHPAALCHDGRVYLYFEADGQIGAAWASSPAGPFTVRRTPLLRRRIWGRTTDPGVLGMQAEVDGFGQITPVTDRLARTDWLLWRSLRDNGTLTLCTLSQDRMELAPGIHRSREIRITPDRSTPDRSTPDRALSKKTGTPHIIPQKTGVAPTAGRTTSSRDTAPHSGSRIVSPQLFHLDGRFYLLWAEHRQTDGRHRDKRRPTAGTPQPAAGTPTDMPRYALWYARADRLNGPWETASPLMTVADAQKDAQTAPVSMPVSASVPTPVPSLVPTPVTSPVSAPVTSDDAVDRISVAATSASTARILTVSDGVSTSFFLLETSHGNPVIRDLSY